MRQLETLRLAILGLLIILIQLTWYQLWPPLRTVDLFVIYVLVLSAVRGPLYGGIYAIIGGSIMDSFSSQLTTFHMFYYLIPVTVGTLIRSRMLLEYRQLGSAAVGALLLLKVLGQFAIALGLHWIDSPLYLVRVNYMPIILECALSYFLWPQLVKLVPEAPEVRNLA
jgi:hypothetical protein